MLKFFFCFFFFSKTWKKRKPKNDPVVFLMIRSLWIKWINVNVTLLCVNVPYKLLRSD